MYESQDVTGTVHKEAAALTGLAEGTIVVGGAGDNPAAAVGTGIVSQGKAFKCGLWCIAESPKNTPRQSGLGCGERSPIR